MDRKYGGPAFPTPYTTRDGDHYSTEFEGGMTLRDYFAIHADRNDIAAMLSERPDLTLPQARFAYADAMLRAREA